MESKQIQDVNTNDYLVRCHNRLSTIGKATITLVGSYMTDGDTLAIANSKVKEVSSAISISNPSAKMDYYLGDTQPLIDVVDSISTVAHFTQAKKDLILPILSVV